MKKQILEILKDYSHDDMVALLKDNASLLNIAEKICGTPSLSSMLHVKAIITEIVTERTEM